MADEPSTPNDGADRNDDGGVSGDTALGGPAGFSVNPLIAASDGPSPLSVPWPHFDLSQDGMGSPEAPEPPAVAYSPPPRAAQAGAPDPWQQAVILVLIAIVVLVGAWACLVEI